MKEYKAVSRYRDDPDYRQLAATLSALQEMIQVRRYAIACLVGVCVMAPYVISPVDDPALRRAVGFGFGAFGLFAMLALVVSLSERATSVWSKALNFDEYTKALDKRLRGTGKTIQDLESDAASGAEPGPKT